MTGRSPMHAQEESLRNLLVVVKNVGGAHVEIFQARHLPRTQGWQPSRLTHTSALLPSLHHTTTNSHCTFKSNRRTSPHHHTTNHKNTTTDRKSTTPTTSENKKVHMENPPSKSQRTGRQTMTTGRFTMHSLGESPSGHLGTLKNMGGAHAKISAVQESKLARAGQPPPQPHTSRPTLPHHPTTTPLRLNRPRPVQKACASMNQYRVSRRRACKVTWL